jgi:hypothetical protein
MLPAFKQADAGNSRSGKRPRISHPIYGIFREGCLA